MITQVYARGFKGLDFEQPLEKRTLITGPVGSGKSARALALALLATGGLPGTGIARQNAEIFRAVGGKGDAFTVGMVIDDHRRFERTFRRKKNGVTSDFRVDGEIVPKNLFEVELDREGVNIADVSGFLALSDAKKVDELFRLFPPAGNVRGTSASITACRDRISAVERDIRAKEQSRQALAEAIAELRLPAGSLPEIQARIAALEQEYQAARDEMIREQARLEHEARAAQEAQRAAAAQKAEPVSAPEAAPVPPQPTAPHHSWEQSGHSAMAALKRVFSALERAGCGGCAARMILVREMRQMEASHG